MVTKIPLNKKNQFRVGRVLPLTNDITTHTTVQYNIRICTPCRARARLYRFVIRRGVQLTLLMLPNLPSHRIRVVVYTRTIFLKGDTILRISGPSTYIRKLACVRAFACFSVLSLFLQNSVNYIGRLRHRLRNRFDRQTKTCGRSGRSLMFILYP